MYGWSGREVYDAAEGELKGTKEERRITYTFSKLPRRTTAHPDDDHQRPNGNDCHSHDLKHNP